jgi:hypothetical protein
MTPRGKGPDMGKGSGGHESDYKGGVGYDTGHKDKGGKDGGKGCKPGAEGILSRDCHMKKF